MSGDRDEIDLATAETTPHAASDGHRDLHALVGEWEGATQTWFEPSVPPDRSRTTARIQAILGGRFVRFEYRGTVISKPHAGEMLIGYDQTEGSFTALWVDSFHMGSGIMKCTGERGGAGAISVLGSYDAGGQTWGWRTVVRLDGEHLVVEATNIAPDGQEYPAIESRLSRRSSQYIAT
jgi:hypothetical protein